MSPLLGVFVCANSRVRALRKILLFSCSSFPVGLAPSRSLRSTKLGRHEDIRQTIVVVAASHGLVAIPQIPFRTNRHRTALTRPRGKEPSAVAARASATPFTWSALLVKMSSARRA